MINNLKETYIMKKLALAVAVSLILTGCGDKPQQQAQYQQQPQYQQPVQAAPVVVNQPAQAPVVVQQQDNTISNMLVGAMAAHTISNMMDNNNSRPVERVVEHRTVVVNQPNPVQQLAPSPSVQPVAPVAQPAPVAVATKQSSMNMNKLSQSANYAPPSSTVATTAQNVATAPKPSSMDMSKLSSNRPTVSSAKPSSSMNMAKSSRK